MSTRGRRGILADVVTTQNETSSNEETIHNPDFQPLLGAWGRDKVFFAKIENRGQVVDLKLFQGLISHLHPDRTLRYLAAWADLQPMTMMS